MIGKWGFDNLGALTPEQRRKIQEEGKASIERAYAGQPFSYNSPDMDVQADPDLQDKTGVDMDAERERWLAGTAPELDRGKSAVIGAIGLYSVIQDMGSCGDGIEDALCAFFDDAKRIAQQSADESIRGQADGNGKSPNQQSLDAIKALAGAIQDAGLENASDPADRYHDPSRIILLNQEISTLEKAGDALAFMTEVARVVQDQNWTQDIESDLENMGAAERAQRLLFRRQDSVPEHYNSDTQTRDAVQDFANSIGG